MRAWIKNAIWNLKLWFISEQKVSCDCLVIDLLAGYVRYTPAAIVFIDMNDITVDEPETWHCDTCGCQFYFNRFGVAKFSRR